MKKMFLVGAIGLRHESDACLQTEMNRETRAAPPNIGSGGFYVTYTVVVQSTQGGCTSKRMPG